MLKHLMFYKTLKFYKILHDRHLETRKARDMERRYHLCIQRDAWLVTLEVINECCDKFFFHFIARCVRATLTTPIVNPL